MLARLADEHGITDVSYSTVRDYVAMRRPQVWAEAGKALDEAFVPQSHDRGAEAEVDFADLWIDLVGVRTKVFLFTLRLSYSGKAIHRAFGTQSQEAFLQGHVEAFRELGGVPTVHVRYDNLKSAVSRVLLGRNRTESERWVTFRSFYGFDAFYCQPGKKGAHEKGGVEGEGGRFRRNHLVPVPKVDSLAELNARLRAYDEADDARHIANRPLSVGCSFDREQALLAPLPDEEFEPGIVLTPRVDRHARVMVRQCQYSVPARLIGQRVRVLLRADELLVSARGTQVARHERSTARGSVTLVLDHYLEVLADKPGALPGATALAQAREAGTFTAAHEAFWAAARAAHGDGDGTRELVEVLLLHRRLPAVDVVDGITAAFAVGATRADVVAVEARRLADQRDHTPHDAPRPAAAQAAPVVSLTQRKLASPDAVIAGLPADHRPPPSVAGYDQLLTRAKKSAPDPARKRTSSRKGTGS